MNTNKTYTEITPIEALRILAEAGKPVEGFAFRDDDNEGWSDRAQLAGYEFGSEFPFRTSAEPFAHCARITITSPIAQGHNPDKLTEDQVGVSEGWRLLTEEERAARDLSNNQYTEDIQRWMCGEWDGTSWVGGYIKYTFRTKHPAGHYLPKPKTLKPWTFETAPRDGLLRMKMGNPGVRREERIHSISEGLDGVRVNGITAFGLLSTHEYSPDNGATWKPCGTEEAGK